MATVPVTAASSPSTSRPARWARNAPTASRAGWPMGSAERRTESISTASSVLRYMAS